MSFIGILFVLFGSQNLRADQIHTEETRQFDKISEVTIVKQMSEFEVIGKASGNESRTYKFVGLENYSDASALANDISSIGTKIYCGNATEIAANQFICYLSKIEKPAQK